MKMKLFSLILILVLSMSMVSSASAYGHGDIREGQIGVLSSSNYLQRMHINNQLDWGTYPGLFIDATDNIVREYVKITSDLKGGNGVYWKSDFNKEHLLVFYIEIQWLYTTNSWKFYDVDYSKGVFIAADTNKAYHQWADVYYYSSIDGSAIGQHVDYVA
jgi:hypothetical protein